MYRRLFVFFILLGLYLSLSAQLQWPQPAKMMEHRDVTWNNSSVNISENVFHAWAQVDGQTSKIYLQATNSVGDSLWQIMPDPNTNIQFTQTSPNIITTSDNCLIIAWIEHNPYPNIRLKAQKINQTGQRLWGENGVYLTDSFTCITYNYLTAFDGLIPDPDGGAYLCFNNSENLILLKVNTTGSVAWQQQIVNTPQVVKICRTYPDGLYLFTSNFNSGQYYYYYKRFSPTGDLLFTGHTAYPSYNAQIHVFPDNAFVMGDPLSNSNITKYSPVGEPLWHIYGDTYKTMTFINENDFYLLHSNTNISNQLIIQKHNSAGEAVSAEVVIPSAYLTASGISPAGKLVIFYRDPLTFNQFKLQILNQNNIFEYEQAITIGNPPFFFGPFCQINFILLNENICMTTNYNIFCKHIFDYEGNNYQQHCIIDQGNDYLQIYNEDLQNELVSFPNYFFTDGNNLTMFQQFSDLRMYKIDSEGNNSFPFVGKTIQTNINTSVFTTKVHKTPANNYILVYAANEDSITGQNIDSQGDNNFNYDSMYPYFQFENKSDCIWGFYNNPLPYVYEYNVHKIVNENTFDNNSFCLNNSMNTFFGAYDQYLIYYQTNTNSGISIFLYDLTDNLVFNPEYPNQGVQIATIPSIYSLNSLKLQQTSQGLLLSWITETYNQKELRLQLIRVPDLTTVYPFEGHLIVTNLQYYNHQICVSDDNVFNVLYRDLSLFQNKLVLQKYILSDNELVSQFGEEGLVVSDNVYTFTAENFGNDLGISFIRGEYNEPTSLFFTKFSNTTNGISNNIPLGLCLNLFKPQLLPIDNQNTYLVWTNAQLPPFENYSTFLVQKIDVSQLPVNDQAISPTLPLTLAQNYPNPFNPETQISFTLPSSGKVKLEIFNIKGQRISTLLNAQLESGQHNITWKGTNSSQNPVSSGIYFYKLTSGNKTLCRKMLLIK